MKNICRLILGLTFLLLMSVNVHGQPPIVCSPADNCSSAPSLTCGVTYNYNNGTCGVHGDCTGCDGGSPPCGWSICACCEGNKEDCTIDVMGPNCFLGSTFCGSAENTNWARYCAPTTGSYNLTVSSVSCTGGGASLQFGIYAAGVTCGTNNTGNLLNCTGGTTGPLTYTQTFTAGQCYLIVFDGNAGAACTWNFFISCLPLPVKLSHFDAYFENGVIKIDWETTSEVNNKSFTVERKYDDLKWDENLSLDEQYNAMKKREGILVPSKGDANSGSFYQVIDKDIQETGIYLYDLFQQDMDGSNVFLGTAKVFVNAPARSQITKTYYLADESAFMIDYDMSAAGLVELNLYDVNGIRIKHNPIGRQKEGFHKTGIELTQLSTGIYFYELKVNGESTSGKILVRK